MFHWNVDCGVTPPKSRVTLHGLGPQHMHDLVEWDYGGYLYRRPAIN
jgi:hypothetical protein